MNIGLKKMKMIKIIKKTIVIKKKIIEKTT